MSDNMTPFITEQAMRRVFEPRVFAPLPMARAVKKSDPTNETTTTDQSASETHRAGLMVAEPTWSFASVEIPETVQAADNTDSPSAISNENATASNDSVRVTTAEALGIFQPVAPDADQARQIPAETVDTAMADDRSGDLEDIAGPADDVQDDPDDDDGQDEDRDQIHGIALNIPATEQMVWLANRADAVDETTSCKLCMTDPDPMEAIYVECGHIWCKDCLNQYFAQVFTDREKFPPRCCRQEGFNLENIEMHLNEEVLVQVMEKWEEWSASDPTYCANIQCRTFISSNDMNGQKAICFKCKVVTCVECKAKMCLHHAPDMHLYPINDPENVKLAHEQGWKRCPNKKCNKFVDKIEGCDTMKCRCGQQFCYNCGNSFEGPFPCNCTGHNAWVGEVQAWANGVDGSDDEDSEEGEEEENEEDVEDEEEEEDRGREDEGGEDEEVEDEEDHGGRGGGGGGWGGW